MDISVNSIQPVQYAIFLQLLALLFIWHINSVQAATPVNSAQLLKKIPDSFSQVETFPRRLSSGELKQQDIPNPHWKKNSCVACHKSNRGSARNLRHTAVEKICNNCHGAEFDHSYIHPSDVKVDKKMRSRMSKGMQASLLKNRNKINCNTCHDLTLQCNPDTKKQRLINPEFFRSGPFKSRSQLCFMCHDDDQYSRLNPHDQIDDRGKLKKQTCVICHADSIGKLRKIKNIEQLEFNTKDSLSTMCWGCHPWTPHPGGQFSFFRQESGPNHLVKPSARVKNRLREMTEKNHLSFPLEPGSGKIFCGTCHNPHEKDVIKNLPAASGADSPRRLRTQKICEYCHDK